ncbi:MAG TPA: patatin-like phospholipase family protein [Steroidobacteraceae bacterium]|nr:patatin-like phospholipase family protein [Steroidobacteraceae bacterium]
MLRPLFTPLAAAAHLGLLTCLAALVASGAAAQGTPAAAQGTGAAAQATGAAAQAAGAATQGTGAATATAKRPRVGLALAGGGARGGAHIGVLKVLEELHVPVDCIAGTSMGALVGGGYASGLSASEIERFIRAVDWKSAVGGVGSRPLQPAEQKRFDDASGSLEFGLKGGKIVTPGGLIASSRIEDVLRTYVAKARSVSDFDKLPIPYRAVATDMLSGKMVVLDHGDIATAMRASMAIPGAFPPVITDQYVLSDGYIVRNLPIDVVRDTCADIVIAVNLVKPTVTRQQLITGASLVWRSTDITMEENERLQLQTLTARDVRIDVDSGDIGSSDFERTAETIPQGEKAARAVAARLAALSVSQDEYLAWRRRVTVSQHIEIRIADVRFEGLKYVNPQYLRNVTNVRAGDTVDIAAISRDAARLAALDDLQGVEYQLSGDPNNPELVWRPTEKQYGPDYLRLGGGLYAAGGGVLLFELDGQYVRRWLNVYGGQWRNELEIGTTSLAASSLYQPLNVSQTFFVEPAVAASRSLEYVYNDYERVAQYFFNDLIGHVDLGANLGNSGQLRAAYWADRRKTEIDTGVPQLPTGESTDAGLAATGFYDTRDAASFATRGTAAAVQYFWSADALGATRDWQRLELAVREALRFSKTSLWLTAAGGSDLGSTLPADRAFSLGGPQSFPGYAPGEIRARRYWTVTGDFLWRVADILPIANQTLYGGLGLQGARAYDRVDPVSNGALYGVSGYLGGRTPIGTLAIGVGKATGDWAAWLTLGTPVGTGSILNQPLFR